MSNHFLRVFYEDTDTAGIVYYANYFKFIERARSESLRNIGLIQTEIKDKYKIIFVVRKIIAEFIRPAKLDDLLEISTNFLKIGIVSIELDQKIFLNGAIIFKANVKLGILNTKGKPKKLPIDLREKLQDLSKNSIKFLN